MSSIVTIAIFLQSQITIQIPSDQLVITGIMFYCPILSHVIPFAIFANFLATKVIGEASRKSQMQRFDVALNDGMKFQYWTKPVLEFPSLNSTAMWDHALRLHHVVIRNPVHNYVVK